MYNIKNLGEKQRPAIRLKIVEQTDGMDLGKHYQRHFSPTYNPDRDFEYRDFFKSRYKKIKYIFNLFIYERKKFQLFFDGSELIS